MNDTNIIKTTSSDFETSDLSIINQDFIFTEECNPNCTPCCSPRCSPSCSPCFPYGKCNPQVIGDD